MEFRLDTVLTQHSDLYPKQVGFSRLNHCGIGGKRRKEEVCSLLPVDTRQG